MVAASHVRLPDRVDRQLSDYVRQTGLTKSSVMATAVSEWLRLRNYPQIRFVEPAPGDRRAALADGPQVWTIAELWLQTESDERDPATLAAQFGLRVDQVQAALAYWADNREEIDGFIDRLHAAQEEAYAAALRRAELDILA
jgi:hypothetical protein